MTTAHLPKSAAYVVVGMGMHGMSTAWHLAMELERSGKGKGSDVILIDKAGPGAGATWRPRPEAPIRPAAVSRARESGSAGCS